MLNNNKALLFSGINAALVYIGLLSYGIFIGRDDPSGIAMTVLGFAAYFAAPVVFMVSWAIGGIILLLQRWVKIPLPLAAILIFASTPLLWWLKSFWK